MGTEAADEEPRLEDIEDAIVATATAELALDATADVHDLFKTSYDDPLFFFEHVLECEHIRRWQREVLEAIRARRLAGELHTRVHVRAAHGAGKGWLMAGLVLWWQATRPGARSLTTAPVWRDVKQLLWTEIHGHFTRSIILRQALRLGRMLDVEWQCHPDDKSWFATGASSDHPENLEGQHSLVAAGRFIDEAKAVPDGVFTATEGLLSSRETLDVWISTPSTRTGKFYARDATAGDELIRCVVTIDDLIADDVPGAREWRASVLSEYGGKDSFEYRSRAMAEYIDNAEGALFPFSWIERAMLTDEERQKQGLPVWHVKGPPTVGFDVAGSVDGDQNAVGAVHGPDAEDRQECSEINGWHERDTMISKDRVVEMCTRVRARCVRVDVQGLGKGVSDAIAREIGERSLPFFVDEWRSADAPGGALNEIETDDAAAPRNRFVNKKAEASWYARLALEQDRLRLPRNVKLREQMAGIKYEVRNGKIRIVDPKDSPDYWDAVLQAIGTVYHSVSVDDIGGGDANPWGPTGSHLGWSAR